jgi:hypothetical protein
MSASAAVPSDIPPDSAKYQLKDKHPKPGCDTVVANIERDRPENLGCGAASDAPKILNRQTSMNR